VHKIVLEAGFSLAKVSEIDIIVAELTSNLSKHASGGEMLLRIGKKNNKKFVELVCLDDGPGISDLGKVLLDGYSSTSTLGHGLGSIKRLSDEFDIYSLKDWGTIVLSRLYEEELPYRRKQYDFNIINVPKSGEKLSGDGFYFTPTKSGFKILMADGLGHGPESS
jgi:anti-sigma regulatory factor (Ser/Thr protein kinase)